MMDIMKLIKSAPDLEFNHQFKGFGIHDSECKVEIWFSIWFSNKAFCLFTDLSKGTSVTNASEQLVEEIYKNYLNHIPKDSCRFAETYDRLEIDMVIPKWENGKVVSVEWVHLTD